MLALTSQLSNVTKTLDDKEAEARGREEDGGGRKSERELRRLRALVEANASATHKREQALTV